MMCLSVSFRDFSNPVADYCIQHQCQNNARCINHHVNYTCACNLSGWTGTSVRKANSTLNSLLSIIKTKFNWLRDNSFHYFIKQGAKRLPHISMNFGVRQRYVCCQLSCYMAYNNSTSLIFLSIHPEPEFKAVFTNLGSTAVGGPSSIGSHYTGQDHDGQVRAPLRT